MINITFNTNRDSITGFRCTGHAGYAEVGKDIVCAAVSACLIGVCNEIKRFSDATLGIEDGHIDLTCRPNDANQVLLSYAYNTMQDIADEYPHHVSVT